MKQLFDSIAGMAQLWYYQRILCDLGNRHRLQLAHRMLWGGNQHQLILMDEHRCQPVVCDGKRNDTEIHGVVSDGFQNLGVVGALNVHRDIWVEFLETGKHFGKNVQTRPFIGAHNNLSARHTLRLGQSHQHSLPRLQRFLHVFLKGLACRRQGNFAPGSIEQFCSDLLLQRANLRRDGGLGAKTLLRSTREGHVLGYFKKRLQLVKVHRTTQ